MSNIYKKLAGQTAIYGMSSIIGRLLNYLLVPLYTRIFAPEVYGIVIELYAYVGFLLIILTYGMETGFFRFSKFKDSFDKVYSTILTSLFSTSLLFVVLVVLFLKDISNLLNYGSNPEYILWMALIVAIDVMIAIPFAKLRLNEKALKFASIKIINISINIGANLFFLVLCPKIQESNPNSVLLNIYSPSIGVGYVFISNLIANIVTFIILIPEYIVSYKFDKKILKEILIYSLPLVIAGLAGMVNETLDRILLKFLVPIEDNPMRQVGIYGANYKLAILMTLFIQMFRYAAEPFFFAQYEAKNSKQTYANVMKYFTICGLCIFLGVMLYLDIVKYFIAEEFHSGLKVVPILLIANLFLGILYNLSVWYKLKDLTKYGAIIAVIGASITILLNIILIPIYGYMGAAVTTLICYFAMVVISYLWGQKHFKIPYQIKTMGVYFIIALSIFILSSILKPDNEALKYVVNSFFFIGFIIIIAIKENVFSILKKSRY